MTEFGEPITTDSFILILLTHVLMCLSPEGSLESSSGGKMMEEINPPTDESYDSEESERPAERWAPLGAAHTPPPSTGELSHISETERLKSLEEEQEQLNNSLFSLTTHFAQVQFRLKQIVDADIDQKEVGH